ncbi:MAG TPA: DUF4249 domain-containing protein [Bacteroidales bacterium]|nr:DUF4249 domain-containing protein [Bacteroidales bacterium]HPS16718.1 DUF4249 domain-containing protein [Bacteroidales bacterium]
MKLNIFILLLFSFFLISCEKEVKIDIPIQDRKLVAICYAGENDSLQLFFDETKNMNEALSNEQMKGTISLYVNDIYKEDFILNDSVYNSTYIPQANDKLAITATSIDGRHISAFTHIPEKTVMTDFNFTPVLYTTNNGDISAVTFNISDNSSTTDFYMCTINGTSYYYNDYDSTTYVNNYGLQINNNNDPLFDSEVNMYNGVMFTDKTFNGESKEIKLEFLKWSYNDSLIIAVNLKHVTEEYYKYMQKIIKQNNSNNNSIFDNGNTNPVMPYTNISGGYGVFAGYSSDTKEISTP